MDDFRRRRIELAAERRKKHVPSVGIKTRMGDGRMLSAIVGSGSGSGSGMNTGSGSGCNTGINSGSGMNTGSGSGINSGSGSGRGIRTALSRPRDNPDVITHQYVQVSCPLYTIIYNYIYNFDEFSMLYHAIC
jgi:hypothetical protein